VKLTPAQRGGFFGAGRVGANHTAQKKGNSSKIENNTLPELIFFSRLGKHPRALFFLAGS
jgi:hypothetical protein